MKMRIYGVAQWETDDAELASVCCHADDSDALRLLADETEAKREDYTWWNDTIGKDEIVIIEGKDEFDITEKFNARYCENDLVVATGLDGEVIDEDEGETEEEEN